MSRIDYSKWDLIDTDSEDEPVKQTSSRTNNEQKFGNSLDPDHIHLSNAAIGLYYSADGSPIDKSLPLKGLHFTYHDKTTDPDLSAVSCPLIWMELPFGIPVPPDHRMIVCRAVKKDKHRTSTFHQRWVPIVSSSDEEFKAKLQKISDLKMVEPAGAYFSKQAETGGKDMKWRCTV